MRQITLKICELMLFTGLVLPGCSGGAGKSVSEIEKIDSKTAGKTAGKTIAKISAPAKTPSETTIKTSAPKKTPEDTVDQNADPRLPVPEESLLQKATEEIKKIYGPEFKAAGTNDLKLVLANKLFRDALKTKENPARLYVLLRISRDIAAGAGGLEAVMGSISTMVRTFRVDSLAMKSETLLKVAKSPRSKELNTAFAAHALIVSREAIAQDKYELAKQLSEIAMSAAREARETKLVNQAVFFVQEIEAIEKQYVQVKPAIEVLQTTPTDPVANLSVGKFRCFYKGDWQTGLPMLAQGSDAQLKKLAAMELKKPTSEMDSLALGDGWWNLAATLEGLAQSNLKLHAALWYRKVLKSLTGLPKTKVEKRLAELEEIASSSVASSAQPAMPSGLTLGSKWSWGDKNDINITFLPNSLLSTTFAGMGFWRALDDERVLATFGGQTHTLTFSSDGFSFLSVSRKNGEKITGWKLTQ